MAIGLLETIGFTDGLEALDAMCKDAMVDLIELKRAGGGIVTSVIEGDVAAVTSAVEAGKELVRRLGGTLVCAYVIPNPHPDLSRYLKPEVK